MKTNKIILSLLFIGISLLLIACPEESESLLRPKPFNNTVKIRFINMANDGIARSLYLESDKSLYENTKEIMALTSSEAINPPDDSCFYSVKKNGTLDSEREYERENEAFYIRSSFVTLIALHSKFEEGKASKIDTLIEFTYTKLGIEFDDKAKIKVLNAINDTTQFYSIFLGCPGGESIATAIGFRSLSVSKEIRVAKDMTLSLVKHIGLDTEVINTYAFDSESKGNYSVIIARNDGGNETLFLLDEKDEYSTALRELASIKFEDKNAYLKMLNFSNASVSAFENNQQIGLELASESISELIEISTCQSNSASTFTFSNNSDEQIKTSLNVNESYTMVYYDSLDVSKQLLLEPDRLFLSNANACSFRILNLNEHFPGLTISSGAHSYWLDSENEKSKVNNFKMGETYKRELKFQEFTQFSELESGIIPFTIFSSTSPTQLVFTCLKKFKAGGSYTMVISEDDSEMIKVTFIEEQDISSGINYSDEAVFLQIVNANSYSDNLIIDLQSDLGNLLFDSKLPYQSSLATVIESGSRQIEVNGETFTFDASLGNEALLILTSNGSKLDLIDHSSPLNGNDLSRYTRRFVNASPSVDKLTIYELTSTNSENKSTIVEALKYAEATDFEELKQELKYSFIFENATSKKKLAQNNDLALIFGKNYTFIFVGNSDDGYRILIQQGF